MKREVLVSTLACALLLSGSEEAMAFARAAVFSQPGLLNESATGPVQAAAAGGFDNAMIEGEASAGADLSSGVLRLSIAASPGTTLIGNAASASADFSDTITIVGPGSGTIPVIFRFDVDASLQGDAPSDGGYRLNFSAELDVSGNFAPNGPGFAIVRYRDPGNDVIQCSGMCSSFNSPLTTGGDIDATLIYDALLTPNLAYEIDARRRRPANS